MWSFLVIRASNDTDLMNLYKFMASFNLHEAAEAQIKVKTKQKVILLSALN